MSSFVSILHFYAYVTMLYRLVGAVVNLLQANSRFERSWHISTQKSNANLNYFTSKVEVLTVRAIRVCFTWIAKCALHPQPPTTYSHSKLPALDPRNRNIDELLVIGSLCLRKDFWDRHGANIATRWNEMYVKGVSTTENTILETGYCFLSEMDLGDVDTREV